MQKILEKMVQKTADSFCQFLCIQLHKKKGGNLTPLEFHTKLVSQIIENYGENEN